MTGRDVEREINIRILALKVAIEKEESNDENLGAREFRAEILTRWCNRRIALQDLKDWYRLTISLENRRKGVHDDGI